MTALVGYTGFVGSNILASGKEQIDRFYNSKNIEEAFGTHPDLLIFAGLRSDKNLANTEPLEDLNHIMEAVENIKKIGPKKLVLLSTIEVFRDPADKTEDSGITYREHHPYGINRSLFETEMRIEFPDSLIIRLPILFGDNMKENFLYDMIKADASVFPKNTDSRSTFQFYPLSRLWDDIGKALSNGLTLWHAATEPVSAAEIYHAVYGKDFVNELPGTPRAYDYRTKHDTLFGGKNGYIMTRDEVLASIKAFAGSQ